MSPADAVRRRMARAGSGAGLVLMSALALAAPPARAAPAGGGVTVVHGLQARAEHRHNVVLASLPQVVGGRRPPAAQKSQSPPLAQSFDAVDDDGTAVPPDTDGAAGSTQLVTMLNNLVRVQDKSGNVLSTVTESSFWGPLSGTGSHSPHDPRVVFDPAAGGHWIVAAKTDANLSTSAVLFGASQTADATGAWTLYSTPADASGATFADYPQLGFNETWIAISANMQTIPSQSGAGSKLWALDKSAIYAGASAPGLTIFGPDTDVYSRAPAITYDATGTLFLAEDYHGYNAAAQWRLSTLTGPRGAETLTKGAAFGSGLGQWADFSGSAGSTGLAPQLNSPDHVATNDSGIPWLTERSGSLWFAQSIFLPVTLKQRASVQWAQLSTVTDASLVPTVQQAGRIDDPNGVDFYYDPSLTVNDQGDVLIGYSHSSSTSYVSADYAFHAGTDAPGSIGGDAVYRAGMGCYYRTDGGTRNPWGDYSATSVDPADGLSMWTIQEYAGPTTPGTDCSTGTFGSWGTWWGEFLPGATQLSLPGTGQALVAGSPSSPITVQLENSAGQPVNAGGSGVTVTLRTTSSGGAFRTADNSAPLPGNALTIPAGSGSAAFTYVDTVAGAPTLSAAAPGLAGATQAETVSAAAPASLTVTGYPSQVVAGTGHLVTVTVLDSYGNIARSYSGTVHFTSSDRRAVLPADSTVGQGSAGFVATLRTAGTQSLTATDTANATLTGSQTGIAVTAGPVRQLLVAGFPTPARAGTAYGFTVSAVDAFGNTVTTFTDTLHFTSSDPHATRPPNTPLRGGTGSFSATLRTVGTQSIGAYDMARTGIKGSETGIVITAPAATVMSTEIDQRGRC